MSKLSRRAWLQSIGAGAISLTLGSHLGVRLVRAQGAATPTAFIRFTLGTAEITVIQDTAFQFPVTTFASNATEEELAEVLEANNLPVGDIRTTVNTMLVKDGDMTALLDTGTGSQTLPTLALLGVVPEDITAVVISHFHPDHIGGMLSSGAPAFPNAMYYLGQAEWDFLQSGSAGVGDAVRAFGVLQNAGQLEFYASDAEIVGGIQSVAAFGHTPGHHALMVTSGDAQLLNMIDTALNSVISLARPEWQPGFDSLPDVASETRRTLLQRAVDEKIQIFGYHFPFPGLGYVDTEGEGFRFIPTV